MFRKLIMNVTDLETRVALLEDGNIVELFIERTNDTGIAGNIYKGKVQRVLPGMQAAFVDIGLKQAAFIYVGDVLADFQQTPMLARETIKEESEDEETERKDKASTQPNFLPIEELLSEGQEIMIQVTKPPIGTKGPRVTCHISLPGRFLVQMPTSSHIGVSRRIENEVERERLKTLVEKLRKDDMGYIVRTASEGVSDSKLISEMEFLANLWTKIQQKFVSMPPLTLIQRELNLSLRSVRDLLIDEADALIIDSEEGYNAILTFLDGFMPKLKDSVKLYDGTEPIFDAFNLEGDISRALKKKVWLKSGGYIIIEQTEALTSVDVNTGRYVGKHNLEETILKTNLEAVKEIAYQIRLRDISGIIVIDFIDMTKNTNQKKVHQALIDALKKDKSKTHVANFSEMGLIEMTRKRVRKSLRRTLSEPCLYCDGEGFLTSKQTICHNIYREVLREATDMVDKRITLHVNPDIAEMLHGEENQILVFLEKKINSRINIYPSSRYHLEQFDIFEILDSALK